MKQTMEQLEVAGLPISFVRAGEGPPLVLLHGFAGDSREWRAEIDDLSADFTVVAWDAPGAGQSADPPEWFLMADYADCLAGLIRGLGIARAHVVGLSFGGALALALYELALYERHPEIPETLVLASAYAGWTGSLPKDIADERLRLSLQLADSGPDQFVRAMNPTLFPRSADPEKVAAFGAIMAEFHPRGFSVMARSLAEADLREVLPRVDVPTLLLYGEDDVRAPRSVAEGLHSGIRGSWLEMLPGLGHMINIEAPDLFDAAVRSFIAPG